MQGLFLFFFLWYAGSRVVQKQGQLWTFWARPFLKWPKGRFFLGFLCLRKGEQNMEGCCELLVTAFRFRLSLYSMGIKKYLWCRRTFLPFPPFFLFFYLRLVCLLTMWSYLFGGRGSGEVSVHEMLCMIRLRDDIVHYNKNGYPQAENTRNFIFLCIFKTWPHGINT